MYSLYESITKEAGWWHSWVKKEEASKLLSKSDAELQAWMTKRNVKDSLEGFKSFLNQKMTSDT